jgi:23S rRNA-/tRNA-specific pseudouridylate synthase
MGAWSRRTVRGGVIDVEPGRRRRPTWPDASVPFDVLYEDDELIVVSNPPRSWCIRAGELGSHAVAGLPPAAAERTVLTTRSDGRLRPGIVHRIDRIPAAFSSSRRATRAKA